MAATAEIPGPPERFDEPLLQTLGRHAYKASAEIAAQGFYVVATALVGVSHPRDWLQTYMHNRDMSQPSVQTTPDLE